MPSIQSLIDSVRRCEPSSGGDKLVRDVDNAAKLVDSINALGNDMGMNFTAAKDMFAWIGPVLTALQGNPVCDARYVLQRHPQPVRAARRRAQRREPRPDQRPRAPAPGFR